MRAEGGLNRGAVIAVAIGLVALVYGLYGQTATFEFVRYDDPTFVTENPATREGLTGSTIAWAFTNTQAGAWYPVTWLSHMFDVTLFGLNAGGHHLTSVTLHALNTLLVLGLLLRMTGRLWPSALVAALFAVHPMQVEAVAWIGDRKGVLSGTFWLLSLLAYVWYTEHPGWRRYVWIVVMMALGLMTKPTLIMLPAVVWLLDIWPLERWRSPSPEQDASTAAVATRRGLLLEKLPLVALAAASLLVTMAVKIGKDERTLVTPIFERAGNVCLNYVTLLRKAVWPSDLSIPYPARDSIDWMLVGVAGLVLAGVTVALYFVRRERYLLVGWLWFLIIMVPTSGVISIGHHAFADRYMYIPQLGLLVMLVWSISAWCGNRPARVRVAAGVAAVLLVACSLLTWRQIGVWKNTQTLFAHTLALQPSNTLANEQLGYIAQHGPQPDLAAAERHYLAAEGDELDRATRRDWLGQICEARGDFKKAEEWYRMAMKDDPDAVGPCFRLAVLLKKQGRLDAEEIVLLDAVKRNPDDSELLNELGVLYQSRNQIDRAIDVFKKAVAIDPLAKTFFNLGVIYESHNQIDLAIKSYQAALSARETSDAQAMSHGHLGFLFLKSGKTDVALYHLQNATQKLPDDPVNQYLLGVALARVGQREGAAQAFRTALRIKPDMEQARAALDRLAQPPANQSAPKTATPPAR